MKFAVFIGLLAAAGPAAAQTAPPAPPVPVGVDMAASMLDENRKPLPPLCFTAAVPAADTKPATPASDCHDVTMGFEIARALRFPGYPGEDKADPVHQADIKWSRGVLADRIDAAAANTLHLGDGNRVVLTVAEADTIKRLTGQLYPPVIVAQILTALYPDKKPPEIQ
jgi:hypothetical protein